MGLPHRLEKCRGEGTRQTITKGKAGFPPISLTEAKLEDRVMEFCWRKSQNCADLDPH